MVITVHEGVTRADVDRMNAEIGATVIDTFDTFYLMQLPDDMDACDGMDFYGERPEVNSALPDSGVAEQ